MRRRNLHPVRITDWEHFRCCYVQHKLEWPHLIGPINRQLIHCDTPLVSVLCFLGIITYWRKDTKWFGQQAKERVRTTTEGGLSTTACFAWLPIWACSDYLRLSWRVSLSFSYNCTYFWVEASAQSCSVSQTLACVLHFNEALLLLILFILFFQMCLLLSPSSTLPGRWWTIAAAYADPSQTSQTCPLASLLLSTSSTNLAPSLATSSATASSSCWAPTAQ